MALRLVEILLPQEDADICPLLAETFEIVDSWQTVASSGRATIKLLLEADKTEEVLDWLTERFSTSEGFRIVLLPVEAAVPRTDTAAAPADTPAPVSKSPDRVYREELYADVKDVARLNSDFVAMVVLSACVAAIGILRANVAIIIGAMVIAPLLGPNVALSLAATLGDMALARQAIKTNLVGIMIALVVAVAWSAIMPVAVDNPEILARTQVHLSDIVLALAAGAAGALAFTTGFSSTLIGVMVAVALMPPLITVGLLVGGGYFNLAWKASVLFLINVVCLNISGVSTFLLKGIRPLVWWEAAKAKKSTWIAIAIWVLLLAALVALILLSNLNQG